jgi:hypothetical protein
VSDVIITHQNPAKPVSLKTVTQLLRKAGHALESVRDTPLFAMPYIYKNEHFTKTGSGQT